LPKLVSITVHFSCPFCLRANGWLEQPASAREVDNIPIDLCIRQLPLQKATIGTYRETPGSGKA
jgi:hypothetical protein